MTPLGTQPLLGMPHFTLELFVGQSPWSKDIPSKETRNLEHGVNGKIFSVQLIKQYSRSLIYKNNVLITAIYLEKRGLP